MSSNARHSSFLLLSGSFLCLLVIFLLLVWPVVRLAREHGITPSFVKDMITGETIPVRTERDRSNILILGNPGGSLDGADLTDSILFVSMHTRNATGAFLSIPRDIWIPELSEKVNAAYRTGEMQKAGNGLAHAKRIVQGILGEPVHYAVRMDFSGFIRIIDLLDGIEVTVEHPIDDQYYPIQGRESDFCNGDPAVRCRYEHLYIASGRQHMDGATALKYVRSRQSVGEEGTDFSRSKRQQQVLLAMQSKIRSYLSWKHRARFYQILNELRYAIETDIKLSDALFFFYTFSDIENGSIHKLTLDQGDESTGRPGLLIQPPLFQYNGAWVLVPRTGTFDEIHRYVACHLHIPGCTFSTETRIAPRQ